MSQPNDPPFPRLFHGKPDWPAKDDDHLFWVGLRSDFRFAHHPAHLGRPADDDEPDARHPEDYPAFFCPPEHLVEKLLGVLKDSDRGSVLVTGYRGTGKTSLVNRCREIFEHEAAQQDGTISRHGDSCKEEERSIDEAVKLAVRGDDTVDRKLAERITTYERWKSHSDVAAFKDRTLCWIKVNLSTVSTAHEVLLLTSDALYDELARWATETEEKPEPSTNRQSVAKIRDELAANITALRRKSLTTQTGASKGFRSVMQDNRGSNQADGESQHVFEREALSSFQSKLVERLREFRKLTARREGQGSFSHPRVVFVFDELDKLQPSVRSEGLAGQPSQPNKLEKLQGIVAELKYFLTESPSHQVFIAGKDVDDSWAEDQNKGEGLFESIFTLNIYVPSIFSTPLIPCEGGAARLIPVNERKEFYTTLAAELGVNLTSWAFNTALLILPHLAEHEIYHMILRAWRRHRDHRVNDPGLADKVDRWLERCYLELKLNQEHLCLPPPDGPRWPFPGSGDECVERCRRRSEQLRMDYKKAREQIHARILEWRKSRKSPENWWLRLCAWFGGTDATTRLRTALHTEREPRRRRNTENRRLKRLAHLANMQPAARAQAECASVMSERTCRRLRILIEYLTYKGRGIPRKILREFHDMVKPITVVPMHDPGYFKVFRETSSSPRTYDGKPTLPYVLAFPQHHLQKMNFYAGIVEYLDFSVAELRGINDKGRVSIYHIIDYILKFYTTGFSQRDVEQANFMTAREEFYPTRQLASLIVRTLDGRLWRRKDSRSPEFRLMHSVVHDLSVMFLRYAPEQMELRHTTADFRNELAQLTAMLQNVNNTRPDNRLEPVHAQIRLARIMEMTGKHYEARMGYFKALRWLRSDIRLLEGQYLRQKENLTQTLWFMTPFVGYAVDVLLAAGRLHEEMGEYHNAIQLYSEARAILDTQDWNVSGRHELESQRIKKIRPDSNTPIPKEVPPTDEQKTDARLLASTLLAENTPPLDPVPADDYTFNSASHEIAVMLATRGRVTPLALDDRPGGLVDICNHKAVAFSKMWERVSANQNLLRAVLYLHRVGDEYGVIDQMFFIGQIMVRRRDFRAAALWYVEALRRIKALREHGDRSQLQSGADWQTPSVATGTEAQIYAALGDVYFATGGVAFLSESAIARVRTAGAAHVATKLQTTCDPSTADELALEQSLVQSQELRSAVLDNLKLVIHDIDRQIYEDRPEEYFLTCARMLYESVGDHISATDVYLRQLDFRLDLFRQSISWLDSYKRDDHGAPALFDEAEVKYAVLNSWSGFWLGARVLLHAQLTQVLALSRHGSFEWGRIGDFRRMGVLLRLVGDMMRELAMHPARSHSRVLLCRQSLHNHQKVPGGTVSPQEAKADPFYTQFVTTFDPASDKPATTEKERLLERLSKSLSAEEVSNQVAKRKLSNLAAQQVPTSGDMAARTFRGESLLADRFELLVLGKRVAVNRAARDIRTIYAFLSDREELINEPAPAQPDLAKCGFRTLLFRLNGSPEADDPANLDHHVLPLTWVLNACMGVSQDQRDEELIRDFRLLALSEKALLSAYLCHRDTIPDYSYAHTVLSIGELYMVALYSLRPRRDGARLPFKRLPLALDRITDYAKRFIVKAVDVLKREREQNRNTFHLLSEAWFNLGDLLLIRLHLLPKLHGRDAEMRKTNRDKSWVSGLGLFGGSDFWTANDEFWQKVQDKRRYAHEDLCEEWDETTYGDIEPEDVRRQAWDAYKQGLILVHTEMDEYFARFRFPSDVYYAHRNVMDAVLHFRICRAARARHSGGRYRGAESAREPGFSPANFARRWEEISVGLAKFESPQAFSEFWETAMKEMLREVNRVRTDRGPLTTVSHEPFSPPPKPLPHEVLYWLDAEHVHEHERLDIFKPYVGTSEEAWNIAANMI